MDLSVVIPTLNGRSELPATLSAIAERAPDAEVIVANGPSADGTSGFVCENTTVDTVLELSDRNLNVARNAGLAAASGDAVAFLGQGTRIESTWLAAVETALRAGADVVTGPVHRQLGGDVTTESLEESRIGARTIRFFDGGNVVFTREAIERLDGFDEHLDVGAARDLAHRLGAQEMTLRWEPEASVLRTTPESTPQAESVARQSVLAYRSRGYRMAKNYGVGRDTILGLSKLLLRDGFTETKAVATDDAKPSQLIGKGRRATRAVLRGVKEGLAARVTDQTERRNPNGLSARTNRPVARCDP